MKRSGSRGRGGRPNGGCNGHKRTRATDSSIDSSVDGLIADKLGPDADPEFGIVGGADDNIGGEKHGEIFAAVLFKGDRLGISYFDTENCSLYATSMYATAADVPWLIATFKEQMAERSPAAFVTSSHVPEAVRQELSRRAVGEGSFTEDHAVPVKVLPHSTFRLDTARKLLASVHVPEWQPQPVQPAQPQSYSSAGAGSSAGLSAGAGGAVMMRLGTAGSAGSAVLNSSGISEAEGDGSLLLSRPGTALSGYGYPQAQRRPVLTSLGAAGSGSGPLARPATSRPGPGTGPGTGAGALNLQLPPAAAAAIAKAQRLAAAAERIAAVAAAASPPTLELSLWRLSSLIDTSDEMLLRCAGGLLHFLLKSRLLSDLDTDRDGPLGAGAGAGAGPSVIDMPGRSAAAAGTTSAGAGTAVGDSSTLLSSSMSSRGSSSASGSEDALDALLASLTATASGAGGGPAAGFGFASGAAGNDGSSGSGLPAGASALAASGPFGAVVYLAGGLHAFTLSQHMAIDAVTFASLNIFAAAAHPALARGGGKAKDGFSLAALLDRTASPPGKRLLRAWLRAPSLDVDLLSHRHDAVAFLMAAAAQAPEGTAALRASLRHAKDVPRLLLRLKRAAAGPSDWFALHRTVIAAGMVREQMVALLTSVRVGSSSRSRGGGAALNASTASAPGFGAIGGLGLSASFNGSQPGGGVDSSLAGSLGGAGAGAGGAGADPSRAPEEGGPPYGPQAPFLLRALLGEFGPDLAALQAALDSIIDWEASRDAGRLAVRSGLDATLDAYRRTHAALPGMLGEASLRVLAQQPQLASLSLKYLPQIGCVICVDKLENGLVEPGPGPSDDDAASAGAGPAAGAVMMMGMGTHQATAAPVPLAAAAERAASSGLIPSDWTLQFESGAALHYKSPYTGSLDEYLGDIAAVIADLEASIVRQLEEAVLAHERLLLTVGARLAEVDVLLSFAAVSLDYRYCRPRLVPVGAGNGAAANDAGSGGSGGASAASAAAGSAVLYVKGARHPLQELTVDTFVPNDIALAPGVPGAGAVAIVTGPNFSGKSVYLKTVGLIPFMAQVGCFVPAERALLTPVDRLFSRIHSMETATLAASTFTIDLNQVGLMLRASTPRSLLLIDEFGKGTSSVDGVALLAATIRHLLRTPERAAAAAAAAAAADRSWDGAQPPDAAGAGPVPVPAAGGDLATHALQLVPKTVITTHFREVFDHGLLSLGATDPFPLAATLGISGAGAGAGAGPGGEGALPLDLASNVAFFQMNVMLEPRPATTAAAAAAAAAAMQVMGFGAGTGAGAGSNTSTASSGAGAGAGAGDTSSAGGSSGAGAEGPEYEDAVVPLFKLVPGRAASSYGLACALRAGVPRAITDRAAAVSAALKTTSSVPLLPGFLEDPIRRSRERAQLAALAMLLRPPCWAPSRSTAPETAPSMSDDAPAAAGKTTAATGSDVVEMLSLLRNLAVV